MTDPEGIKRMHNIMLRGTGGLPPSSLGGGASDEDECTQINSARVIAKLGRSINTAHNNIMCRTLETAVKKHGGSIVCTYGYEGVRDHALV